MIIVAFLSKRKSEILFNKKETGKFMDLIKEEVMKMPKCIHYKIGLDLLKKEKSVKERNLKQREYNKTKQAREIRKKFLDRNKEKIKEYKKIEYKRCKEKGICPSCYRKTDNYILCEKCREKNNKLKRIERRKKKNA